VGLYEPRGEYQLIVEHAEEAGEGALRRRFDALKSRLATEGLFDEGAKRPLPRCPRRIGVVTSPSGAAIRDILHVLARRYPPVAVLVYPVPVQGEGAAVRIAAALATASERGECDVLILARGGGSLEDLWSFNEEVVARAIRACRIPVISGVGHEVDFTIADFAADRRAPTPSGAAELAVPDAAEMLARLARDRQTLDGAMAARLSRQAERLDWLRGRLERSHPGHRLKQHGQRLDELELRLGRCVHALLERRRERLAWLRAALGVHAPGPRLRAGREALSYLAGRLEAALRRDLAAARARSDLAARALHAVSPLATLERGYAIATRDGAILRSTDGLAPGDDIAVRLAHGELTATIRGLTPTSR
jgi:exodeoxyribonuclease VII large subunit